MTFSNGCRDSFIDGYIKGYQDYSPGAARPQQMLGAAALGVLGLACAWTLWNNAGGTPAVRSDVAVATKFVEVAATRGDRLAGVVPQVKSELRRYVSLFDARALDFTPGTFVKTADASFIADEPGNEPSPVTAPVNIAPRHERTASAPASTPSRATASLADHARGAQSAVRTADWAPDKTPKKPSIFERLFGRPFRLTLAYAAPETDNVSDDGGPGAVSGRYDRDTAVYDISAHMVYLPDGTRLEAHSGIGYRLDDPRSASERNRGVTPPTIYDLTPRESLFHGVRALRLTPEDSNKTFGRTGLLAHSFMLGPNGDSNGCVSFRDYDAFLRAYQNHQIKRLAVVARLD